MLLFTPEKREYGSIICTCLLVRNVCLKTPCCSHFLSWVVTSAPPEIRNVHPKSSSEDIHWKPGTVSSTIIIFFNGCLLPFVLSLEPFMHPLLTGRCPARQGDNQIISPVVEKCQSFPLQTAEGKPGVGVVTGVICCSWMSTEGTQGTQAQEKTLVDLLSHSHIN